MPEVAVRTVLYARISEDASGERVGVERQMRDARALAEVRGWEVLGEYVDNDLSALSGGLRPGYEAMVSRVRAGGVDRIVVWQLSRLWRNREERGRDIGTLSTHRCGIFAVKGPDLDLSTAYGRGMAGLLGEFDTLESEVKGERVAAAAIERARSGRPNGGLGYGWRRDEAAPSGWVVAEDEAAVVREIVRRVVVGDTLASITNDLNRRGVPAPGAAHRRIRRGLINSDGAAWGKTSVVKLARRPSNAAIRVHHQGKDDEQRFDGAWPALVSRDEHETVEAILTGPRRSRGANPGARRHLLSWGIGRCGVCGGVLRVATRGNSRYGKRAELYVCDAPSGCVGRNKAAVDQLVEGVVVGRLAMPDASDLLVGDDTEARAAATRARELRARLDRAADEYADGKITVEQMTRVTARVRPEIEDAEQRATAARRAASLDRVLLDAGAMSAERWAAMPVADRRLVVEVLVEAVVINPVARRGPGFDPASVEIVWRA